MINIEPTKAEWELPDYYEDVPDFKTFEEFVAKSYVNEIKRVVLKQKYRWRALSPKYYKYKANKGLSTGKWISTGFLLKNLRIRKFLDVKTHYYIGFKVVEGVDLNFIARCNEYGTIYIPARPLFRRTLNRYKKELDKLYKKYIASAKSSSTLKVRFLL